MKPIFRNFKFALYLALAFYQFSVHSQEISQIDVLTTEQGLMFRDVISVSQDSQGLMWFGTPQGLIRYDGYNFKNYNSNKQNPYFIPVDQITGELVFDGEKENLWYMANDRLFKLNIRTDQVSEYNNLHNVKGTVLRILKTSDGDIWIVTDDYWITQNQNSRMFLQKLVGDSFKVMVSISRYHRGFSQLFSDPKGEIWWNNTNGTYKYNEDGDLLESHILNSFEYFGANLHYVQSFLDSDHNHYYFPFDDGGINQFNGRNNSGTRLLDVKNRFYYAVQDAQNHIWFAGQHMLYRMSPEGQFVDYSEQLKSHLDYTTINRLFIDANDLLWVATDNGLFKIRVREQLFNTLFKSNNLGWGNTMRAIFEDREGSIFALCEIKDKIFYKTVAGQVDTLDLKDATGKPVSLHQAADFFVWDEAKESVYTGSADLLKINVKTGVVKSYENFKSNLRVYAPNPIIKLADGRLLFGYTLSRLVLFDPQTEENESVFKETANFPENEDIRYLEESQQENIVWIGTQNDGLLKLNLDGTIEKSYHINSEPSITRNFILVIEENTDGSLWVGTYGGGLNHISEDGKKVKSYTKSDGLPDNNIVGIIPDENNNLWISTYNGLSYFDIANETFQNFYVEDGLSHNEFNYTSFLKDGQGKYYFGGMNGITTFEARKILKQTEPPAMKFIGISGYNSKLQKRYDFDFTQTPSNKIEISPYDDYFQINWAMPSYFQNQKNTYSTKIEGYEENWFFQGNTPFIRYNKLPAGDYVLKIKGFDSRGNESSTILSIPLTVKQIYYKQEWFIALLIICIGGIIYAIFQYRLQQLMAMERLRTQICSDLHDDVGSMLSGLAMQTELMEMNAREEDKSKLHKITNISRNAVSQMRDLVWSIDSRREKVSDLVERMHELAEELLLPAGIGFKIDADDINLDKKLSTQVKQNLFLIYKEAINNILKHSDATMVTIALKNQAKACTFLIKDNGKKSNSFKSTGLGLANMAMRAEKIKGKINFEKREGFEINLNLPYSI